MSHYSDNWAPEQAFDIATEAIDACIAADCKPGAAPAEVITEQAEQLTMMRTTIAKMKAFHSKEYALCLDKLRTDQKVNNCVMVQRDRHLFAKEALVRLEHKLGL